MTREELNTIVDLCRDGTASDEEYGLLTEVLRAGGSDAEWIIENLMFAGLLAHALDPVDEESFMRGYQTRLAAESDAEAFVHDTGRHLKVRLEAQQ